MAAETMDDELAGALSAFSVTSQPASATTAHPLFSLYKVKNSASSQEERRRKFLEAQKSKRYNFVNHARGLATNEWDATDDEVDDAIVEGNDMDVDEQMTKPPRTYRNQLMLSEWMIEVPEDLALNWLLVLCPVGKRCLVIASRGTTRSFSRSGYCLNKFPSCLPGGCKKQLNQQSGLKSSSYSILDCIYCQKEKTYYILDVMCWNSHPLYDSDTEFRFYWNHTKVTEVPEVMEESSCNPYKFVPLPYYKCDKATIQQTVASDLPFPVDLDGLLFFHKNTHYRPGPTPLIVWLKGFMLPEILNIPVPEHLCKDRPSNYTTMKEHLPKAFEKFERRKEEDQRTMQYEET